MQIRRLVTGDIDGKSAFVSDDYVPVKTSALFQGVGFHPLWGAESTPELPSNGAAPSLSSFLPCPTGFRFVAITFPPALSLPLPDIARPEAASAQDDAMFSDLAAAHDVEGWHTTDSVDMFFVVKGEVALVLDEEERVLRAGDCFVQNGTRHRWRATLDEPCQVVGVILGGARVASRGPAALKTQR